MAATKVTPGRGALAVALLMFFGACSATPEAGLKEEIDDYVSSGRLFQDRYSNFARVDTVRKTKPTTYDMQVEWQGKEQIHLTVTITEVKVFRAYQDPVFADSIYKWYEGFRPSAQALKASITNGTLTGMARVMVSIESPGRREKFQLTGALEAPKESSSSAWRLIADRVSAYHAAVEAFERAYEGEKSPEFAKFRRD